MSNHFGIGLGDKNGSFGDQLIFQHPEILNDAIVHHDDIANRVRMGIRFGDSAMGRPPGMSDAGGSAQRLASKQA